MKCCEGGYGWRLALTAAALLGVGEAAHGANITWIGGFNDWVDNAGDANWSPADEPDTNDVAIFSSTDSVDMGSSNSVLGLTISNSTDLSTSGHDLTVNGLVQLSDTGTSFIVEGDASQVQADDVTIDSGSALRILGGTLTVDDETGNGVLDINTGSQLNGYGTLHFGDALAAQATLLINDGAIIALRSGVLFAPPEEGTLSITATSGLTRIDLDGAANAGAVQVFRNQTLDVNLPVTDAFSGTMTLGHHATLDIAGAWSFDGEMTVDNGFVDSLNPFPDVPADTSTIAGGTLTQTSGTITVVDGDGTLRFEAPYAMNGGALVNNGLIVFDSSATIAIAANVTMPTATSSITVAANRTVNINASNFNMDGSNTSTNVLTVESGGTLNIATTDYDPDSATNAFDGTINVNSGTISVDTGDAEFVMDGTANLNKTGSAVTEWEGTDQLDIGNDVGALDANLNIGGNGNTIIQSQVDFNSDADVDVAMGCGLILTATTNFNTVNGGNHAEFTGAGVIAFNGQVNFNEAVTFTMPGGTVDLDGLDTFSGDTVNVDAAVTVNAAAMGSFGKVNTAGVNTLDINSNVGTGSLTVNLDNPADEWTLNAAGVMNLVNDAGGGTLLAGNDVNLDGTVNVTGGVGTTARVDVAGTVNVAAASALTLQGGSLADPNRLAGGTVNGPGNFSVSTGRAVRGFGTINAPVSFVGTAELLADDGELTLGGNVNDAGKIGTADADGVLNIVNAWNTSVADNVVLAGGELKGGTATVANANGIQGRGTISSRVINNSKLAATGGTLLVQTAGNDNDWDGAGNTGVLEALSGDLEMVDTTGGVPPVRSFGGTVRVGDGHRAYANGFALNFLGGSSLELEGESIYQASSSTDIGGTLSVGAGADATIEVANNFFLTFEPGSATTLNGDLTLLNNNIIIKDNAAISGGGALHVPDGSNVVAENGAEIDVVLNMDGGFRPGNSEGIARVDILDLQLSNTSDSFFELTGTGLSQYDRLVVDGVAIVDGFLSIDIDDGFVPALGQTFNIITAGSVIGEFDFADASGMPPGLAFHVEYLPNAVQLQVVNEPSFTADFDEDGDVDQTDLTIWRGAFALNQLGDADGDNDSDGADFLTWQRQAGSAPAVAAGAAVPEPRAWVLVGAGLLAGCLAVRRAPLP